ncbi:MAG TPA: T9SS type A sorting domain-containing protein [Saprospiraceae bacterium]|nr:T9SS type A sorting domain-containing protein [Saprospiraceae bacterium]
MKVLFLILILALYLPLGGQIVFEEVDNVPGTFWSINESRTGLQSAVTSDALFGKTVPGPAWIERDQDVSDIYDLMYSPDGDLYTKNNNTILYSQDNGETFASINFPNGIFPPFNYTYVYVLDDDMLFVNDYGGHCYYSLNNGQSWIWAGQLALSSDPEVRLVDNFIYIADPSFVGAGIIARINVDTGQNEIVDVNTFGSQWGFIFYQILEDGTVIGHGRSNSGPQNEEHLLQFKFGQDVESLGIFPNLVNAQSLYAVGSTLYAFELNIARVFNGIEFQPLTYIGLPQSGDKYFLLSENDHVYAIVDHNRIFRSVATLAYPGVISGKVYLDEDQGCIADTAETGLAFWNITVEGENFFRSGITGPNGTFKYSVPDGEYTVKAQPPATGWDLCEDEINVLVDANQPTAKVDFLSLATVQCANLSLDFSTPLLRRCFENYYTIRVRNTGPQASVSTVLNLNLDPFFEFHSASIPYLQTSATTVSLYPGVLELNADLTFRIFFKLSCDAELGMEHCLSGNLTDDNICIDEHTSATECQTNIGSFDPNDKRSFNEHGRESAQVDKDEYITYHIRFQNTGTDTAFTVRIIDPLFSYLDLGTLEMLSSSHPYTFEITDGRMLVADFKNILLPDSTTNEAASHGFLKFRIKPLPSFDYGTTIPNKADIFFDFNDPVLTNEAITVILPAVSVHDQRELIDFTVFPNPAKQTLQLQISETHRIAIDTWIIYDNQGRIAAHDLYRHGRSLNITALAPGAYTLLLMSNKEVIGVKTFVKE